MLHVDGYSNAIPGSDNARTLDGQLMKRWEVHCAACERPNLSLKASGKPEALAELRREGWETRQGLVVCDRCAGRVPKGENPLRYRYNGDRG